MKRPGRAILIRTQRGAVEARNADAESTRSDAHIPHAPCRKRDSGVMRTTGRRMDANRERQLLLRIHERVDMRASSSPRRRFPLASLGLPGTPTAVSRSRTLVQVACIGRMDAIDGFDIRQEVRFSSYADASVLGDIRRRLPRQDVGHPRAGPLQDRQLRVARCATCSCAKLGHAPSVPEIAAAIDAPVDVVAAVLSTYAAVGLARRADWRRPHPRGFAGRGGSGIERARCARYSTAR